MKLTGHTRTDESRLTDGERRQLPPRPHHEQTAGRARGKNHTTPPPNAERRLTRAGTTEPLRIVQDPDTIPAHGKTARKPNKLSERPFRTNFRACILKNTPKIFFQARFYPRKIFLAIFEKIQIKKDFSLVREISRKGVE